MKIKALALTAMAATVALAAPTNTVGLNEQGNPIPAYAAFLALYNSSGGDKTVGAPYDNGGGLYVHYFNGGYMQDFKRADNGETGAILFKFSSTPYWVHGGAWKAYTTKDSGLALGYPTGNESNGSQSFEHGTLVLRNGEWRIDAPEPVGRDDQNTLHVAILNGFILNRDPQGYGSWYNAVGTPTNGNKVHRWEGGWIQDFSNGQAWGQNGAAALMYRDGETIAHFLPSNIWNGYLQNGGPKALGYPTGADVFISGPTRFKFERGTLVFNTNKNAWELEDGRTARDANGNLDGAIMDAFNGNNGQSWCGHPHDNGGGDRVHAWGDGVAQDFQGGGGGDGAILRMNGSSQAFWVGGSFWSQYVKEGGATGRLGFPVSGGSISMVDHPGGQGIEKDYVGSQSFEHGIIRYENGQMWVETH